MSTVVLILLGVACALAVMSLLRPRHEVLAVAVIVLAIAGALPLLVQLG